MNTLTLDSAHSARVKQTVDEARAYVEFTRTTASYPTKFAQLSADAYASADITLPMVYVALGLGDETGEFAAHFKNTPFLVDQDEDFAKARIAAYAAAWKELGDVQWYLARMCEEAFPQIPYMFDDMVGDAMQHTVLSGTNPISGYDLQAILTVQCGIVLGVVKKALRDGPQWDAATRSKKNGEMSHALFAAISACVFFAERTAPLVGLHGGYAALLRGNANKLQDRKDRGVLHGDGNDR